MLYPSNRMPTTTVLVVFQQRAVANWSAHCLSIGDCLTDAGYAVAVAKGYDDALAAIRIAQPEAVVVSTTKLDGDTEAFLGQLDRDPCADGTPTVLISSPKSQVGLEHIAARKNPRTGYLSWPLKCSELRLVVQDLLQTDPQPVKPTPGRCVVLDPRFPVLRGRSGVITVTTGEYRLAEHLITQRGRPITVQELLVRLFSFSSGEGTPALVRAHVASLRRKVRIVTGGDDLIRPGGKDTIVYLGARRAVRRRSRLP